MSDIRTPRTDLLFVTNCKCQHETCEVKSVKFTLKKDFSFEVLFESKKVKHEIGVTKSRPISGEIRNLEKAVMVNKSASVEHAKRINMKSGDIYLSGNRDKIGTSPSTLKQISYEGRTDGRLNSIITRMKIKYLVNDKSASDVKGFTQLISVDPAVLFLWTRGGIRIFHDICKMDAVTWDTTSKIVKTRLTDKPLYYYELTV